MVFNNITLKIMQKSRSSLLKGNLLF